MRSYVITTGVIFGLLALAHLWRIVQENRQLATDPWFVVITLAAAAMSGWAWRALRQSRLAAPHDDGR